MFFSPFQLHPATDLKKTRTNFLDLVVDIQIMIVDQLDLSSLLSLAETNQHLASIVETPVRRILRQKKLFIANPFVHDAVNSIDIQNDAGFIRTQHFETAVRLLKHSAHSIQSIAVHNNLYNDVQTREIYRLLNLHHSETLTEIQLRNAEKTLFGEFKKAFSHVKDVDIDGNFNNNRSLAQVFPNLQRITMIFHVQKITNTSAFDIHFSHLEYLRINMLPYQTPEHFTEEVATKLIQKNPQIRDLVLVQLSSKLLKIVATALPNLINLIIDNYDERDFLGESIHFASLKRLRIKESSVSFPSLITFDNLDEFATDQQPRTCLKWLEFVENYTKLKRLRLKYFVENETIERITSARLSLEEIELSLLNEDEIQSVIQLIESGEKLKKVLLRMPWDSDFDVLHNRLNGEWMIHEDFGNISLEKK